MKQYALKCLALWYLVLTVTPNLLPAQELESIIDLYLSDNGDAYIAPLASVFTTSLNSGFLHSAEIKKGFHIEAGIVSNFGFIPKSYQTYVANVELQGQNYSEEAPTIFGNNSSITIDAYGGTTLSFPAGLDLSFLPLAAPHIKIGSVLGTEAIIRFWGYNTAEEELGRLQLFGWGLRHSISQYLGDDPSMDIAISYYQQSFDVGTLIQAKSSMAHLQAGNTHGIFNYYLFTALQSGDMNIYYEFEASGQTEIIDMDLKNEQSFMAGAGFGLKLAFLYVHAEANVGKQLTGSAGIGIGF